MSTFESNIKQIPHTQQAVYATLSDLSNLQALKDGVEQNRDRLPKEALEHIDKLKDLTFDTDSLTSCKMKLTVKGDIPFMLKAMVSKPLQEGVEKVADMLAMIPYKD